MLHPSQIAKWIQVVAIAKFVSYGKCWAFFFQRKFNSSILYFSHYIHILFTHCIPLSKEILPIPKITPQNAKNALQFLKKNSPAMDLKPYCTMHFYCKVNLKGQFECWKASFMFDIIFLDIYENPRKKNFINPSRPKHP